MHSEAACFSDCEPLDPVKEAGEGIEIATVADRFGNVIGLIEHPDFAAR